MVQRIKVIKDALGISENELARRLGISQSTLNGYTLGKRKPSYDLAESVLNAFSDVSAEWLMRGEGPMYISDLPSTDHDDSDEVIELKAEITRLRAERDELVRKLAISERRIDKLIDILHQEPEPRFSIVAEEPSYNHRNNIDL